MNRAQDFILIGNAYLWLYEFTNYGSVYQYVNSDTDALYLAEQLYVEEMGLV